LSGSRFGGFFSIARKVKLYESPSKAGGLPSLNYDDVNRLCSEIGDRYRWAFVNVNLRPYYAAGAKTHGFEIAEQMGWKLPRDESIVISITSNGFQSLEAVVVGIEKPHGIAARLEQFNELFRALWSTPGPGTAGRLMG